MYILNKIVWALANPLTLTLLGAAVGAFLISKGGMRRRIGGILTVLSLGLLWFASTVTCVSLLGMPLERNYVATQKAESLPKADAIVVLGGGIGKCKALEYPDMFDGADRVWHAARLWKAGRAPIVVVSGTNDLVSTVPLLLDLGVNRDAIVVDNESRNTYENSRYTERMLKAAGAESPSVLLVTSAWHMPRARGNFAKTSLKVIPAACDFSAFGCYYGTQHWYDWLLPSADSLMRSNMMFKEWLGKLARK